MKTMETKFKIMLAANGGMVIGNEWRQAFSTDEEMASSLGKTFLEDLNKIGSADAEVSVTIKTQEG